MNDFDFDYSNSCTSDIDRMLSSYMRTRRTDDLDFLDDSLDFSDSDLKIISNRKTSTTNTTANKAMFN